MGPSKLLVQNKKRTIAIFPSMALPQTLFPYPDSLPMTDRLRTTPIWSRWNPQPNWNHDDIKGSHKSSSKQPLNAPQQQKKMTYLNWLTTTILQRVPIRLHGHILPETRIPSRHSKSILQVPTFTTLNKPTQPGDAKPKDSTYNINDNCRSSTDHFHVTFPKTQY